MNIGIQGTRFKDCERFKAKHNLTEKRITDLGLEPFYRDGYIKGFVKKGSIVNLPSTKKIITVEQLNDFEKDFYTPKVEVKRRVKKGEKVKVEIVPKMKYQNSTGYRGVTLSEKTGRFIASIAINRKKVYLGLFWTAEQANEAYQQAKKNRDSQSLKNN